MDHTAAFKQCRQEQLTSVFFKYFPGEVRDKIFTFALNCYEDPKKLWDVNTPYVRPGYSAGQVADTALLQTCQRIYAENWFRPWVSAVHTFYLTSQERRPEDGYVTTIEKFQPRLNRLYVDHGEVEVSHVQVFAQMYALESLTSDLIPILCMDNFFPRKLTVSLRHHDWWWWESDHRLRIDGAWIRACRFPDSLREICIELESLQRKKNQVDWIADEMIKSWHLRRLDGTIMSATKEDCKVSAWSGSSTWGGQRWIRDETKPGVNEYYVKTITWKPNKEKTKRPEPRSLRVPESFAVITGNRPNIRVSLLERAGVPAGLPGDETVRQVEEWEQKNPNWGRPWLDADYGLFNPDPNFGAIDADGGSEEEDDMWDFEEPDPEAIESEDEAIDMAGEISALGQDPVEDGMRELSQAAEDDQGTDNADGEAGQSTNLDEFVQETPDGEDEDEDSDGDEADEDADEDEDNIIESSDEFRVVFHNGFDDEDQDMSEDDFSDDDHYEDNEEFEDETAGD